jgi:hypothetical protein
MFTICRFMGDCGPADYMPFVLVVLIVFGLGALMIGGLR